MIRKSLLVLGAAALSCSLAFADDFDSFGDFGDFGSDSSSPAVSITGNVGTEIRAYVDEDSFEDVEKDANVNAGLTFEYSGSKTDAALSLNFTEDAIKNHPEDVIDELTARAYFGNFTLEGGKMKVVWGKGDKLHVLDNFNADDYTDFIIPDYIDRRISTPMVRGVYNFGVANLQLEGIYTPMLPTDRFAKDGRWVPAEYQEISKTVTEAAKYSVKNAFTAYNGALLTNPANQTAVATYAGIYLNTLTKANALSANPDMIYPNIDPLEYGQFGTRLTGTIGSFDLGVSYYYGYYKQPSFNAKKFTDWMTKYFAGTATEDDKFLAYDRKQTFGLEAATTLWHFNLRGEAGYNLTDDVDGTDPYVHNNSISWLGGFDIDLPFWNMNINIQETGTFILHGDECDKNTMDVDYSKNGYSNDRLVMNVTTSFVNDKLLPEVTVMYGIENGDIVVLPKFTYKVADGLSLNANGMYIWNRNEDSEFYAWKDNSFVAVGLQYQF